VLIEDPAADVHEWYGRFLYFAPEEIEPVDPAEEQTPTVHREKVQRKES
jgi:hypothetical protein